MPPSRTSSRVAKKTLQKAKPTTTSAPTRRTTSASTRRTTSASTRRTTTSRVTASDTKPKTRKLTSKEKEKEIKKIKAEEEENAKKEEAVLAIIAAEEAAIAQAQIQAPGVASNIASIVIAALKRAATTTSATPMHRMATLINDQTDQPLCIPYATSRAMVNIIFPEDTFSYLTPQDRLAMMEIIIPYLGLPPDSALNFDGKLIPDFLNALVFELNKILPNQIPNISMDGISVQGYLPKAAVPKLNKLLLDQTFTKSDNQCTSPLWTGYGHCDYFNKYIVVYVILPKKSSDYLYGLRHNSNDKMKNQLELIALSKQNYDITYDDVRGLYSTKFLRDKRKTVTVGHALVIKGKRVATGLITHLQGKRVATGLITHLLVRNSWGDCEDPLTGGYWVPIEFFEKNTYAAFQFV